MDRIERILSFLKENPNDSFLEHALALEYIKLGEVNKAKHIFLNLLNRDPAYIGSYYHLAKLLESSGLPDEAINWYRRGMIEAKKQNDMKTYNELETALEDLTDDFQG